MALDIPEIEPNAITAGSTVKWTKNLADFKPEDGWVLSYSFYNASYQVTVTATDNGDSTHLVTITAAISAAYNAGDYRWQSFVTKASERYDIESGEIRINANPAASAVDGRSHVKKTLDAINTAIETRAAEGIDSYSVEGFAVTKKSTADLLTLKTKYESWYAQEQKANALSKGLGHSSRVRVRI